MLSLIQGRLDSFLNASDPLLWLLRLMLGGLLLTAAVAPLLAPISFAIGGAKRIEQLTSVLSRRLGLSLLMGSAVILMSILILRLLTLLGWASRYIAVAIFVCLCLTIAFGYSGVSLWVTGLLKLGKPTWGWVFVGGWLVLLLECIPLVGVLFAGYFVLLATGIPIVSGYGSSVDWLTAKFQSTAKT